MLQVRHETRLQSTVSLMHACHSVHGPVFALRVPGVAPKARVAFIDIGLEGGALKLRTKDVPAMLESARQVLTPTP
jgi:hypothetical protein